MTHVATGIKDAPLDPESIERAVDDPRCGAVVRFEGVVRNHDAGDDVTGIDYSAHPLAEGILAEIAAGIASRDSVHAVEAHHRVGHLDVGDVAMVVVVSAEHRAEAFAAASDLVDEVKARLPVWKKQFLADGTHAWSGLP